MLSKRSSNASLQARPNSPWLDECFDRAVEHHRKGDLPRAERTYRDVLAGPGNHFGALHLLGVVMLQTGRFASGLELIDKALAINPNHVDALNNRGNGLKELRRLDEALVSYDKALAIKPDYAEALSNRGNALKSLNRQAEALASYDKALAIKPNYVDALSNRGLALKNLNRLEEALASYDKALAIKPDYVEALNNRGGALAQLKRLAEAAASYDKALKIKPNYPDAIFNRALVALLLGDFRAGWRGYESRWDRKEASKRKLEAPYRVWRGENISGKRIIVFEEQGLGDIIQFSRYLKQLSVAGADVTFILRPSMRRLIAAIDGTVFVTDAPRTKEILDYQCALMSLPLAFGTTLENLPAETPYLSAEPRRVHKWRERIGDVGFKIGVAWQGNKAGGNDFGRSFALANFLGVSRVPDVRLISLQKNDELEQFRELPEGMRVETLGDDYDAGDDAFLDAAAVIETLDLVISADTSIAHLAGALGRPVWVALRYVPDWRWMLDRADSPWYPTMRLFRQRTRDDWREPFLDIESALRELIGERRSAV